MVLQLSEKQQDKGRAYQNFGSLNKQKGGITLGKLEKKKVSLF